MTKTTLTAAEADLAKDYRDKLAENDKAHIAAMNQLEEQVENLRSSASRSNGLRITAEKLGQEISSENASLREQLHSAELEAARLQGRLSAFEEIYEEPIMVPAQRYREGPRNATWDFGREAMGAGRPKRWFHRP
jgi:hypothetical protein